MNRQKRSPSLGDLPLTHAKGGARDRLRDIGSRELAQLAKKMGNAEVGARLGSAREKRDALLAFVEQRLAEMQATQQAEMRELADRPDWWQRVARGKPGFTLPDPARWAPAALAYRRAIEALCAGDLGRGAQRLDEAVRAERAAFESLPVQVELPAARTAPDALPDARPFVTDGETAPPRQAPELLHRADAIRRAGTDPTLVPGVRSAAKHDWWDAPEEEAESADGKPKDGKERKPR